MMSSKNTDSTLDIKNSVRIEDLNGTVHMEFYYGYPNYRFLLDKINNYDDQLEGVQKLFNKFTGSNNVWFSLLFFESDFDSTKLIGFYYGTKHENISKDSYIELSQGFRGKSLRKRDIRLAKGLCREFAGFTFKQIITQLEVDVIRLNNAAGIPGCLCYTRAAIDYGFVPHDVFDRPINNPKAECSPPHIVIKVHK
ncbi:unnamed protein product [marine sediment metagenome]|uniref:N-acetyltransferase domain-containing protein n=1 Tax=marine sediment metagenome TaxID=412755 RepID=X1AFB3_9ZZZZ